MDAAKTGFITLGMGVAKEAMKIVALSRTTTDITSKDIVVEESLLNY